jgi:hypothetical protein
VGQDFRGSWVNRRRMAEKGVLQGTGYGYQPSRAPHGQMRPRRPMRPSWRFRSSRFARAPRPPTGSANPCPVGQDFRGSWVN